jgi:dTDP-4-dehydrorhamnose 3,5-epimerase
MNVTPLALPGLLLVESPVFRDARGSFTETWNRQQLSEVGVDAEFVQDNLSVSKRYTLRGLHYQVFRPQGKLVRVIRGTIFDVVVDVRRSSQAFGRSFAIELAEDGRALWIPAGFAHGFLALADDTVVQYKVTDYWAPGHERTLLWSDPALGLRWPLLAGSLPTVSGKDAIGALLADAEACP